MNIIMDNLPLFIPLIVLQLGLMIAAIVHILRHPQYRFGNRLIWLIIVIFGQLIGPIVYFVFGKEDAS